MKSTWSNVKVPKRGKTTTTSRTKRRAQTKVRSKQINKRQQGVCNANMIMFKAPNNAIVPRQYFTKMRSRYCGTLGTALFSASGHAQLSLIANDPFAPFRILPAINITWMDGVSPLARTSQDFGLLCNLQHYLKCQVLASKTTIRFSENTLVSDDVVACITPSITSPGTVPATVTAALAQPYNRYKEFAGTNLTGAKLNCFTKWNKFIGIDKTIFDNDQALLFTAAYNASPTTSLFHVININTMDCSLPASAIGFQFELEQYVRFSDFAAASVVP